MYNAITINGNACAKFNLESSQTIVMVIVWLATRNEYSCTSHTHTHTMAWWLFFFAETTEHHHNTAHHTTVGRLLFVSMDKMPDQWFIECSFHSLAAAVLAAASFRLSQKVMFVRPSNTDSGESQASASHLVRIPLNWRSIVPMHDVCVYILSMSTDYTKCVYRQNALWLSRGGREEFIAKTHAISRTPNRIDTQPNVGMPQWCGTIGNKSCNEKKGKAQKRTMGHGSG